MKSKNEKQEERMASLTEKVSIMEELLNKHLGLNCKSDNTQAIDYNTDLAGQDISSKMDELN